jgi:hypothetical protein
MMNTKRRNAQRGISFLGLLCWGVVVIVIVYIGAKVVPTATEYMAIQKAVRKAAEEGGTVVAVQTSFDRSAEVNYISTITGKDLDITKDGDKVIVSFAYDKEIPLAGPVYLLIKYSGTSASGYR